ncbi:pyridoxal phosphate-dependent transferase [Ochromonadaceae sp. CCMP2298]|nr:pyridoxal phosphate-dependent transferase [Ochromonadaceae sp. CCMP2298]
MSFLGDQYDPVSNPGGAILFSVAENKLNSDLLLERLNNSEDFTPQCLNYTDPTGLPVLKSALSSFLGQHVFTECDVKAEHLIVSAGVTSLLVQLAVMLFEPGDSVLVPTPYYAAFDRDFLDLGRVRTMPVHSSTAAEGDFSLRREDLDAAYESAFLQGAPPKCFLLTNPHNPLGKIYPADELLMLVEWCRERELHLLCDEIYALSVFDTTTEGAFQSLASLLGNQLGDTVHLLWGASKDLGGSGLRIGVLYSQNQRLLKALGTNNMAHQVSNPVQELLAGVLSDAPFLENFLTLNSTRIAASHRCLTASLTRLGLPFYHAGAGIFLFADLRSLLGEQSFQGERALHRDLAQLKISLTPGEACHHPLPGFFRVCFCWVGLEAVAEACRRLEQFAISRRALNST